MEGSTLLSADRFYRSFADIVAKAAHGIYQTTESQLIIGVNDGIGGDLHQFGHVAYRGDTLAFGESPRQYTFVDVVDDMGKATLENAIEIT